MVDTVNIPPANTHSRMYTSRRPRIRVNMNRNADCGTVVPGPPSANGRSAARPSAAALTLVSKSLRSKVPLRREPVQAGQASGGPCRLRKAWRGSLLPTPFNLRGTGPFQPAL